MIHNLTDNSIAVDVPEDAYGFQIPYNLSILGYQLPPLRANFSIDIPEGNWEILGRPEEMEEEQAQKIIEEPKLGYYKNYEDKRAYDEFIWLDIFIIRTAIKSFQSLLKSKNLNPESVIILIKKYTTWK